jgi:hypothetical protein
VGNWALAAADIYGRARVMFSAKTDNWLEDHDDLHRCSTVFDPGFPWTIQADQATVDLVLGDRQLRRKVSAFAFSAARPPR